MADGRLKRGAQRALNSTGYSSRVVQIHRFCLAPAYCLQCERSDRNQPRRLATTTAPGEGPAASLRWKLERAPRGRCSRALVGVRPMRPKMDVGRSASAAKRRRQTSGHPFLAARLGKMAARGPSSSAPLPAAPGRCGQAGHWSSAGRSHHRWRLQHFEHHVSCAEAMRGDAARPSRPPERRGRGRCEDAL